MNRPFTHSPDPSVHLSRRTLMIGSAALPLAALAPAASFAQASAAPDFRPKKTVTLLCAYPAGALGDGTARFVAKGLSEMWGVPVVVENKTGAAGMIAAGDVAKGPTDGTMLLCLIPEALTVARALNAPLGFDGEALRPIAYPAISACVLVTNAKSNYASYADLKAYALANPGQLNFGIQGTGSAFHLAMERWAFAEGIKANAIPYRGGAPALTDLLAGQIDAMFVATSLGLPYIRDGRLRALAATTTGRIAELGDVRTLAEMGVAGFDLSVTIGILASSGTPDTVADAINADIRKVMRTAEARQWMAQNVVGFSEADPTALRRRMREEVQSYGEIARRANIKLSS
jgi:tripartite-type tricarboxylate transporter receptor subunit TctC